MGIHDFFLLSLVTFVGGLGIGYFIAYMQYKDGA